MDGWVKKGGQIHVGGGTGGPWVVYLWWLAGWLNEWMVS